MVMERIVKSQLAKMFLLLSFLSLLFLTPFISTSLRSSYLYFLFNLLIIVLGVEAGILASIPKPPHDDESKKPVLLRAAAYSSSPAAATAKEAVVVSHGNLTPDYEDRSTRREEEAVTMRAPVKKKLQVEKKMVEIEERVQKLKRCISKPSIFFIGSCHEDLAGKEDVDRQQQQQQREEEVVVGEEKVAVEEFVGDLMSKQELFMKAETFIGNFYKQLRMQREETRKNIHGLYHRAF